MGKWILLALLVFSAPLAAQDSGGTQPKAVPDKKDEKSGPRGYKGEEGPLTFSINRTGWGLSARLGFGYDTNIFKEDRHDDAGFFGDGQAAAYFGVNLFKALSLGVEGRIHGRLYFGQDDANDANEYDVWLAAFIEKTAEEKGQFGGGLRVEALYDQRQFYEIYGPITRLNDLRRAQGRARSWFSWMPLSFLRFEWGASAVITDFTEERVLPSNDSWLVGADFAMEIRAWRFFNIAPYVAFDYEWFRDQFDVHPDKFTLTGDKLQLLRYEFGAKAKLRFWGFNQSFAKVYARRQDDSAQGFFRYWQYGLNASTVFNIAIVRVGGGFEIWTREFDEIPDPDVISGKDTVFERYMGINAELSVNFFWTIEAGIRYDFGRRASDLQVPGIDGKPNSAGYVVHQITIFIGFDW